MSDLKDYIKNRKENDRDFSEDYEKGYENFKIGVMLKNARIEKGMTQKELADKLKTKKTAISRIENHAEDIRLSTIEKFANALGKEIKIVIE